MKRFIKKLCFDEWLSKDNIEKKDLVDVKDGFADFLIDTVEGKYYNPELNSWKEVK
jgi:hypothetical protein